MVGTRWVRPSYAQRDRNGSSLGFVPLLVREDVVRARAIKDGAGRYARDTAGLTVSEFLGVVLCMSAGIHLFVLHTKMPLRSPYVDTGAAADKAKYAE